ncbi:DUF5058 family protein [Natronobacterium texcoconense]|nr:DUF5058 family protein [Natronobacterium texcoconense]
MDVANSEWLWLAALPVVLLVLVQAALFMRRAWKTGKEMGLSEEQMKSGIRSGVISAIGPAVAVLVGMLALIATVGGPMAWMRLSVIGSVMFEIPAAEFGVGQLGYSLGDEGITEAAFATAVWTMTLGALGWLLVSGLFTPKMENIRQKVAGGKESLLPVITSAAMLGAFSYLATDEVVEGTPRTMAVVFGGVTMLGLLHIADKHDIQWIREWALGTAMIVGLLAGMVLQLTVGTFW